MRMFAIFVFQAISCLKETFAAFSPFTIYNIVLCNFAKV